MDDVIIPDVSFPLGTSMLDRNLCAVVQEQGIAVTSPFEIEKQNMFVEYLK